MKKLLMSVSSKFSYQPSKIRVAQFRFYCDRPPSSLSNHPGPVAYYKSLVNQGKLKHDSYQEKVSFQLENLLGRLDQYEKDMEEYHVKLAKWEENREDERRRLLLEEAKTKQQGGASSSVSRRRNFLNKWLSRNPDSVEPGVGKWVSYLNREKKLDLMVGQRPTAPPAPKGLYIYGNVGSGKTKRHKRQALEEIEESSDDIPV